MGMKNFAFCTRHGMLDVRHYMVIGFLVMSGLLLLVSQSSLQALVVERGIDFAKTSNSAALGEKDMASSKSFTSLKAFSSLKTGPLPQIPKNFKLTFLIPKIDKAMTLTQLASLRQDTVITRFSPKDRTSCSVEAARAAANGDTSKISPCITALLSGDEDALVNLPEKMSAFFIETMNSDNAPEDMANIMINSMMKMMEAITETPASE